MPPKGPPPPPPPAQKGGGKGKKGGGYKKPLTEEELEEQKAKQRAVLDGIQRDIAKREELKRRQDDEATLDIEDVDLTKIDPTATQARVKCERCEKEVLVEFLEDHRNSHSSEILPWLFLGGQRNMENDKELTIRTGITHILNLAQEYNLSRETRELWEEYNKEKGLPCVYHKICLGDTKDQDLTVAMPEALAFLRDLHVNPAHHVLVNCVQGISRSSSVVIGYLMHEEKMTLRAAYDHVKARRSIADPRKNFLDQLGEFEKKIFGLEHPSLTGEEVFAGRAMLDVD